MSNDSQEAIISEQTIPTKQIIITKNDYFIAAIVGVIAALFAIPTLINLGLREPAVFLLLPVVIAILWAFGVWFGGFLAKWLSFFAQLGKFTAVGFMNTSIDFGILNIMSILSGITAGLVVGGINVPGFIIGVTNSYLWNKLWVFKSREGGFFSNFPSFLLVNVVGLLLNSGVIILLTTYSAPLLGLNKSVWLNVAKVAATVLNFFLSFIGFKFFVFKK